MTPDPWPDFIPRAGAVRYTDADGVEHRANPHDMTYSTVTMLATEFWDGAEWKRIWPNEDGTSGFGALEE